MVMPSSRKNRQSPPQPVGAKEPLTVADWIELTAQERPPEYERVGGVVRLYGDDARPTPFDLKQPTVAKTANRDDHTKAEAITLQLRLLWVDPEFWKLAHEGQEPYLLRWHIQKEHGLSLPEYPANFWKALAKRTKLRGEL